MCGAFLLNVQYQAMCASNLRTKSQYRVSSLVVVVVKGKCMSAHAVAVKVYISDLQKISDVEGNLSNVFELRSHNRKTRNSSRFITSSGEFSYHEPRASEMKNVLC